MLELSGRNFSGVFHGTVEIAVSNVPGNITLITETMAMTIEDQILSAYAKPRVK